jgi:hypothetical protein
MAHSLHQISVGFQGGQVVAVRVEDEHLRTLYGELGRSGWHELVTEDGRVRLDLGEVVYVRVENEEHRVGFGA